MILALDSSILIDLERGNKETLNKMKKLVEKHQSPACIPFIVYFEVYYGILQHVEKNKQKAYSFLQKFPVVHTTQRTAEILAEMKKTYEKKGRHFSLTDLLIASQVKEHGFLLVTKDTDFASFEDIQRVIL